MNRKISYYIWATIILVLSATSNESFAYRLVKDAPFTVQAGQYVFKMLPDAGASGLYTKNGKNPLWTVDWYSKFIFVASDGKHLIRIEPTGEFLIEFYLNGKSIFRYTQEDLSDSIIAQSKSLHWWKDNAWLDASAMFHIRTLDNSTYKFDITSGKIVEHILVPTFYQTAVLYYKDGRSSQVNDIGECPSDTAFSYSMIGINDSNYGLKYRQHHYRTDDSFQVRDVQEIIFPEGPQWEINFRSGKTIKRYVFNNTGDPYLCSNYKESFYTAIEKGMLTHITFNNPRLLKFTYANDELRGFQDSAIQKSFCNTVRFEENTPLYDKIDILNWLNRAHCRDPHFLPYLQSLNNWASHLPDSLIFAPIIAKSIRINIRHNNHSALSELHKKLLTSLSMKSQLIEASFPNEKPNIILSILNDQSLYTPTPSKPSLQYLDNLKQLYEEKYRNRFH